MHIYEIETKRKNGIVDNIRSLKQDMKRRRTEHNANEEARRNVPRTSITTAVNDRIRRRKRSFTVVYNVKYDRRRSYFVVLPATRFTVVYRRVVYDEIRSYTIVCDRILSFTPSYSVVFINEATDANDHSSNIVSSPSYPHQAYA